MQLKIVHLINGAGIRTHDLQNISPLPKRLDHFVGQTFKSQIWQISKNSHVRKFKDKII